MARSTRHSARDARTPTLGQTRQAPLLLRARCTPGVPWAARAPSLDGADCGFCSTHGLLSKDQAWGYIWFVVRTQ